MRYDPPKILIEEDPAVWRAHRESGAPVRLATLTTAHERQSRLLAEQVLVLCHHKLQSSWRVFYCFHTFGRIDWIGSRLVRAKDGRGWPTRVPQKILVRK